VKLNRPESALERDLARYCSTNGILWIKQTGQVGIPDRLLVLPNGRVAWVEIKTEKGMLSKIQKYFHLKLRERQHNVYVIRSREEGIKLIQALMGSASVPKKST
jgi:hypothetical protein